MSTGLLDAPVGEEPERCRMLQEQVFGNRMETIIVYRGYIWDDGKENENYYSI